MNSSLWTEKYRPKHLADIRGHESLTHFLKKLAVAETAPHLILYGPPGTGKTSLAMAFAADMYPMIPLRMAVMYLNASDERTIETVKERICEFLRVSWHGVRRKIVIFDEVETMTEAAQLTLRSLMDDNRDSPLFIFLCNTLSRIVPAIRSRALAVFVGHLSHTHISSLIQDIADKEGCAALTPTPLACLLHRGDMRTFLQRAQEGTDPNKLLSCIQRLFNAPTGTSLIVWEEAAETTPLWILCRHVMLFYTALCLPKTDTWIQFLSAAVSQKLTNIATTWESLAKEIKQK